MKIKNIIVTWLTLCLLVTTVESIAEQNQVLMLASDAKKKLTTEEFRKLKGLAASKEITVVIAAATLPANPKLVCDAEGVAAWGWLLGSTSSWLCDTEYSCPSVMSVDVIDTTSGATYDCDYDCDSQPTNGTCSCDLQSGESAACPQ